jgi:hypothetical protein
VTEDAVRSLWIGWGIAFTMLGLGLIVTGQWIWICSCLVIGIVALLRGHFPKWFRRAQPAALSRTEKEARIINFLHRGDVLRSSAPKLGAVPHSEIPFDRDVDEWINDANRFLSTACARGASAYFLDVHDMPIIPDQNLYTDAWMSASLLDRRMERLRNIMAQGERYLS